MQADSAGRVLKWTEHKDIQGYYNMGYSFLILIFDLSCILCLQLDLQLPLLKDMWFSLLCAMACFDRIAARLHLTTCPSYQLGLLMQGAQAAVQAHLVKDFLQRQELARVCLDILVNGRSTEAFIIHPLQIFVIL